jgi:hypothetical protein
MDSLSRRRDVQGSWRSRRSFLENWPAALGALAIGAAGVSPAAASPAPRRKPYVFVTLGGPDDGGDFGPRTPGTRTSGLQEAIDYAHANFRDVYIFGGRGGLHHGQGAPDNVYTLDQTLRIPWSQDFRLDGGNYVLAYPKGDGAAVHIDSQMNCRYKLGLIASNSKDPAVWIRPETPGPDDFTVITASVFDFSAVCSGHPQGTAIRVDSTKGPIINCKIFAEEFNSPGIGVHLTDARGAGHSIANNHIQVMFGNQGHSQGHCAGLRLGDPGSRHILHNRVEMSLHAPQGAHFDETKKKYVVRDGLLPQDAIGADVFAQGNFLSLAFYGKRPPGEDIVFEPESRDNTVFAFSLPNGITNKATIPNNKIIPNWPVGFGIATPAVPATGEFAVNSHPYTVQVIILDAGEVSQWTLADPGPASPAVAGKPGPAGRSESQTISGGLTPGQTILLAPGDRVRFTYAKAPAWRWKAV